MLIHMSTVWLWDVTAMIPVLAVVGDCGYSYVSSVTEVGDC